MTRSPYNYGVMQNDAGWRISSAKTVTALVVTVVILVALGVLSISTRQPASPTVIGNLPLRVVYKANANYLVYFIARDKGFLKSAGVTVTETEMESSNLMIQALAAGQADFNPSTAVPPLYAAEQNAPGTFRFLYVTLMAKGRANDAMIVKKGSPLKALADLKGKRVGCPPGATSLVLLKVIFARAGLDVSNDLTLEELEPRTQLQALAAGQVDALLAIEPVITLGEEKGISQILDNEPIETFVMDPIPIAGGVVTTEFARKNPEVIKRLSKAMELSIDFIRQHEPESRAIMARAISMPEQTAGRLGINTYWKLGEVNKKKVQDLADLFLKYGGLHKTVNTEAMYLDPVR